MKNLLLLSTFLITQLSYATVYTVSNNVSNPGQYTTIQAAVDVSSPGDTIYVHGSPTAYAGADIFWQLTVIGSGYNNPNGDNSNVNTDIRLLRTSSSVSASGTIIIGIKFNTSSILRLNGTYSGGNQATQIIENILIERCMFGISTNFFLEATCTFNNITVRNNVFSGGAINFYNSTFNNIDIYNNLLENWVLGDASPSLSQVHLHNNVILNKSSNVFTGTPDSVLVENNIFWGAEPTGCTGCTFNNNITYNCISNTIPYGGNFGSGNIINQDPLFVNYPITGGVMSFSHDYHLQSGSPAIGAATDGGDIGMYGNPLPFEEFGSNPSIPQMQYLTLPLGSSVGVGTNLNVEFKSYKQN